MNNADLTWVVQEETIRVGDMDYETLNLTIMDLENRIKVWEKEYDTAKERFDASINPVEIVRLSGYISDLQENISAGAEWIDIFLSEVKRRENQERIRREKNVIDFQDYYSRRVIGVF